MAQATIDLDDLINLLRRQLGIRTVAASDELLADLGAESIDIQNLMSVAEERYQVVLEDEEIAGIVTVADLHKQLLAKLGSRA